MVSPKGQNDMRSSEIFAERDLYMRESHKLIDDEPMDLWYRNGSHPGKLLYGRVNPDGDPVIPKKNKLKQFTLKTGTLFALDFVVEAYEDFKSYWSKKTNLARLREQESPFFNVEPVAAWTDTDIILKQWMTVQYQDLTSADAFMSAEKNRRMTSFEEFVKLYLEYTVLIANQRPVSRSSFVVSNLNNPLNSGLMVELFDGEHGDDLTKYNDFIQDPYYENFADAAERFGFVLDKNAPWRLIADISSNGMSPYLEKRGITNLTDFFSAYYTPAYLHDTIVLSGFLKQLYNSVVKLSPQVSEPVLCESGVREKQIVRKGISDAQFKKNFGNSFWLRVYTYVRAKETRQEWDQIKFEQVVERALQYEEYVDMKSAMSYLNLVFGGFQISSGRGNFVY